ncbi:MAG: hypothetical protein WDN06_15710 [Asticcacaulis sp.]
MDYTEDELEDLATMRALRLRLRALAEAKVAECEAMGIAQNWLDMHRQIRAITAADRMIVSVYSPPPRRKSRNSRQSPPAFPPPPYPKDGTSVPGEVAASAAKLTEGAPRERSNATVKVPPPPAVPSPNAHTAPILEAFDAKLEREVTSCIDDMTQPFARWAGIWPDGAPYVAGEADWQTHTLTVPFPFSLVDDVEPIDWIHEEVLHAVNAITRAYGEKTGRQFDGQPYNTEAPAHWSLSANLDTETQGPAAGEIPGPPCLPWWIVRKPPD